MGILDVLNPNNWFQQGPDNSAYTIGQFSNLDNYGNPSMSDAEIIAAGSQGPGNPYGGSGATTGTTTFGGQVVNPAPAPAPAPAPQQQSGFDASKYPGWDPNAAYQDWLKTGGPQGGSGGGIDVNQAALNASRNAFNSAYDPVFSQLDAMAGLIPQQQITRQNSVNDLYGAQQNELQTNMKGSVGALDASRGQVAASKAQSIRDLQQQMNQMSKAGGMQLGSAGAGDSSAARMYNFALSKAAGQSSADVSNQANSQYAQIQGQEQSIKATYDDQMAKLGTWKSDNTNQVVQWAQDQLGKIQQAKLTATGQKAAALAATETGLIQNALQRIQQIDDQITSWNQGIQTWALNRMATIDDAKTKMSGFGQYNSAPIVASEIQGLNNIQGANSGGMTGFYQNSKKKDENFLNSYGR